MTASGGETEPPIAWIDTHAHMDDPRFDGDRDDVLRRAREAGVQAIITCGSDVGTSKRAVALAGHSPGRGRGGVARSTAPGGDKEGAGARVFAAAGIHPHEAGKAGKAEDALAEVEALARLPEVVAIGEIGLDYHYHVSTPAVQMALFEAQLDLARRLGLPVVVHAREAEHDVLDAIARFPGLTGVMHAFAGTPAQAERALALGWYLGAGGMITFPSAGTVREAVRRAPPDRLLVETDAPYLAPVPHRGRRNEPAHVAVTGRYLARMLGIDEAVLAPVTSENARRLFRLP